MSFAGDELWLARAVLYMLEGFERLAKLAAMR